MAGHKLRGSSVSLAARVVREPKWSDDDTLGWVQGKARVPCRSAEEASTLRDLTVERLRCHGDGQPLAMGIADRLAFCVPANPCASGACPVCGRSHQRWFVSGCRLITSRRPSSQDLHTISLVPDFGRFRWDQRDQFDPAAFKRKVKRALQASGIARAFGGLDFSMNFDIDSDIPHLQVHIFLIGELRAKQFQQEILRNKLNESGKVKVPVRITRFDGDNAGFAYALKYEFFRREGYLQPANQRNDGRVSLNTRNRPLRGRAAVQLAILLDRLGLEGRLLLIGVKRIQRNGEVKMILLE